MRVNMLAGLLKEQNRPSPEMAVASRQGPYVSVSFHNVFRQALQSAQSSSHQRHSLSQRKRCHAPGWYNLMAVATQSAGQVRLPLNQVQPWAQRTESAEPKKQLWRRAANLSIFSSRTNVSTLRKLCKSKSWKKECGALCIQSSPPATRRNFQKSTIKQGLDRLRGFVLL